MKMFHEFNRFKKGLIWYVYTFHKSRKIGYIWLAVPVSPANKQAPGTPRTPFYYLALVLDGL